MNDVDLELRLQEWQPELPDHKDFRHQVWSKIEQQSNSQFDFRSSILSLVDSLNRPRIGAPITIGVLLFAWLLAVYNGRSVNQKVQNQMATTYHKMINPGSHHHH